MPSSHAGLCPSGKEDNHNHNHTTVRNRQDFHSATDDRVTVKMITASRRDLQLNVGCGPRQRSEGKHMIKSSLDPADSVTLAPPDKRQPTKWEIKCIKTRNSVFYLGHALFLTVKQMRP